MLLTPPLLLQVNNLLVG